MTETEYQTMSITTTIMTVYQMMLTQIHLTVIMTVLMMQKMMMMTEIELMTKKKLMTETRIPTFTMQTMTEYPTM